ncbi:MFS general substrate transporter [Dendrothele bispora CBS 962.96]|uniref:MFS general substrate transporter n=1 Tax=Dendrothele bispora (strain CBS 962.96) TaxID=1314807 RepID=A0A4S8M7H5_DENBC|nr:MFS general substrate transporter [Dendrothele bispora CBS 962.96]
MSPEEAPNALDQALSRKSSATQVSERKSTTKATEESFSRESPKTGHENHDESALTTEKKERDVVDNVEDDWENDPLNARNWSSRRKWTAVAVVSAYTFIPPLASSIMAPSLPEIGRRYAIESQTIVALTLSIFLVSFGIGPLVLAPLSEMYGRTWILHLGNIFSMIFALGCAFSPNVGALLAFRFLMGFSGAAPIACGGGSISDLFSANDRAMAMSLYTVGPLLAPAIGPIAGGFLSQSVGVRYVFIVIAACCAVASLFGIPFLHETYAPVLQKRRAKKNGSDPEKAAPMPDPVQMSKARYLWLNLARPVQLLTRSFICFILSLFMAFIYGIYYLMFATFADSFHDIYGFGTGTGGLAYLGLGIGFLVSTYFGASTADSIYKKLAKKNGGVGKPEMRIPALFVGSLFVPIGLFWYGWSAQARVHWIMPIIGSGIFGFGEYLPAQLYLVDSFTYAASALAAASVLRCLLGFAFPLFAAQMFNAMGLGPGNSLLGGLAIILGVPFPIWIYYKGEEMRARNPLTR